MEIDNPARVLRFWTKVIVGSKDECWWWTGHKDKKGYGNFRVAKDKCSKAHKFSWVLHFGFIPKDLHVDHKCENESCVNPFHLQLLTNQENNEKSTSPSAENKRKTHCIRGHPLFGYNLYVEPSGTRVCIACKTARENERRRRAAECRAVGQQILSSRTSITHM